MPQLPDLPSRYSYGCEQALFGRREKARDFEFALVQWPSRAFISLRQLSKAYAYTCQNINTQIAKQGAVVTNRC